MKHFCIYTNSHKDKDLTVTGFIRAYFEERGIACSVAVGQDARIPEDADCVLALGGDGTMLQAARAVGGRHGVSLLGINMGTLGYLTEVEPDGISEALGQVLAGDYELESRMMLNGTVHRKNGERREDFALNDIVIGKAGSQQVLQFHLYVNRKLLNKYLADGMIVTTPTGSTGYNLSAGGPIVEPSARLLVLTPICPHTMIQRSIVLSAEDEIVIEIPAGRDGSVQRAAANFDGCGMELETGDAVRIVKSERTTDFIKLGNAGFLEILHKKMSDN